MKFPIFFLSLGLAALALSADAVVPNLEQQRTITLDTNRPTFSRVIKKIAPSIVNIYSSKTVDADPQIEAIMHINPMLRDLFGDELSNSPKKRAPHQEQALGSGVIVSHDGYILTNSHVVDGADDIEVSFANSDERKFLAKVIGEWDAPTDLAVLKIASRKIFARR